MGPVRAQELRIVVAAEEAAGAQALALALECECQVLAVLTSEEGGAGRLARKAEIEVLDPALVREASFAERLAGDEVDLLLNVHSLHVADAAVVEAPRIGAFNLHPGPLPEYAGLNSPLWAIYNGERRHAVTLHRMVAEVDAGPIAYEAWFEVAPDATGLAVSVRCAELGLPLVGRLLEDAATGRIPALPPRPGPRRWHGRETPTGGRMDWSSPARRLAALVRAADFRPLRSPWGWPRTTIGTDELEIVSVAETGERCDAPPGTIGSADGDSVAVATADEWLKIVRLRLDGVTAPPKSVLLAGKRLEP